MDELLLIRSAPPDATFRLDFFRSCHSDLRSYGEQQSGKDMQKELVQLTRWRQHMASSG